MKTGPAYNASRFSLLRRMPLLVSLAGLLTVIYEYGFGAKITLPGGSGGLYVVVLVLGMLSLAAQYAISSWRPRRLAWWVDALYFVGLLLLVLHQTGGALLTWVLPNYLVYLGIFWVFAREFSDWRLPTKTTYLNPARLFVGSFLGLVILGSLLLMLPKATREPISYIDAVFTSTSAVCVTGLIVVDTATQFSKFGQVIIMLLIQVGGLGIMTFTSYFSYFFRGESSFQQQMALRDMTSSDKVAEVFQSLRKIIALAFIVEGIGAVLVYLSVDHALFRSPSEVLFFSVFHAISGFCNAGFSTFTNGLYESGIRYNYPLHLILAGLFIIGGIGFPIAFNFIRYLRHLVVDRLIPAGTKGRSVHIPWIINLNTRIVLITTGILLLGGTLLIGMLEWNNTLAGHPLHGKLSLAFFNSATPRTAGFNVADMTALHFPTLMLILFLMWVGASPASTGGGIKTSTLALATLNYFSIARGKVKTELYGREISNNSIRRAFALISLSLVTIGFSIFFLSMTEKDQGLLALTFESISAYSTVGLSLNVTPTLSQPGKMIIILTMFVGRVSLLSILISLLPQHKSRNVHYPKDEILIN